MYNWHARLKRNCSKGIYMIRELVTDEALLAKPCEPATAEDGELAQALLDTLE